MEICERGYGSGFMDVECCNGASGCSCGGQPVDLNCTYCGGSGKVQNQKKAEEMGHKIFMKIHGNSLYHGSGPT